MTTDKITLLRERANLRTLLIALAIAILGIVLLYLSAKEFWRGYQAWQVVVRDVGGLLLVTVAIALLWELWVKRAFLDELLAKAQISKEITFAGLVKITDSFHQDIDWKSYFRTVNKLDIFVAYARTWRSVHRQDLEKVAVRQDARIRVVLPDPEDEQTVVELARRFGCGPEDLIKRIREAETDFTRLRSYGGERGAQIDIWFFPGTPRFSFYRFDRIAIFALYNHRREQASVPTFVCEMGGTLYDYIRKEFDAMIQPGGLARLITDDDK